MNIYALKGHKVKCKHTDHPYKFVQKLAEKHLQVGKEYTVEYTKVHSSSTDVYLQGFSTIAFNSVLFEDVEKQPEELDKKHPDWKYYNH